MVGFRVFRGEDVRLIVTGMGRVACAAGVAALGERTGGSGEAAWLNIGIAGHAGHRIGTGVHALSIVEAATDRRWYPPRILDMPGRGETICTVDTPESRYPDSHVYDMEASAFYATALRYASGELIQVYKIISDNRENGVHTVSREGVRESVVRHLPAIDSIVSALSGLADELDTRRPGLSELEHIITRWHFTVSQQHQLRELMRRWETLTGGRPVLDADLNRCPSAKSVLGELSTRLNGMYGGGD
jgi:adenosylhomocysteine nucleosidase